MPRKLLLITGASKGIGLATARLFLDKDYRVINISRSDCPLDEVSTINIDLVNPDWETTQVGQVLELINDDTEIALVHNAALMTKDTISDVETAALRQVLQLNVIAPAQLNKLILPKMATGSSIIYISSTLGTKAVANTYAYVISKHAVIGQMRATCQDLAGQGIHTAAICPGFTETEMLQEHLGKQPELLAQITSNIALGRLVQPHEIAEAIWFCARSAAVNGTVLHANLGQIEY